MRRFLGLIAIALLAGVPARPHETTRARHEAGLDPRETRALGRGESLHSSSRRSSDHTHVTLRLTPRVGGPAIPGLVRIRTEDGAPVALPGLVNRGIKLRQGHPARQWFAVTGETRLVLPPARVIVEALAGLESERALLAVDLRERPELRLEVPVRRFRGVGPEWRSGNTHLHLSGLTRSQADEYLRTIPQADGLELLFVSYLERAGADRDYVTNQYSQAELQRLGSRRLRFGNGEEHRHNFEGFGEGYGHVMFLNLRELIRPVSIGRGIMRAGPDWPPLRRGITTARRGGATVVWCHNAFGLEDTPSWLAGLVHAHNIFDGGRHGRYDDTFYRYLNLGLRVPFSTGTDWFLYDFSRVYARVSGPLTPQRWLRALAQGRSFITNGPLLELSAGRAGIGDTLRLSGPATVPVRARATGRGDFRRIELVRNGDVIASARSYPSGEHFVAELSLDIAVHEPGWLALRVAGAGPGSGRGPENEMGEILFGHTSPIYVEVAGRGIFRPDVARSFIREMETAVRAIEERAQFDNTAQREEVLGLYREGIRMLQARLEGR